MPGVLPGAARLWGVALLRAARLRRGTSLWQDEGASAVSVALVRVWLKRVACTFAWTAELDTAVLPIKCRPAALTHGAGVQI